MSRLVTFSVVGEPAKKGSWKIGKAKSGRLFLRAADAKEKAWHQAVAWSAKSAMGGAAPTAVAVQVGATFHLPKPKRSTLPAPRGDLDKLLRSLLDAMTGIVYLDDVQVTKITASKSWTEAKPGVDVVVLLAPAAAPGRVVAGALGHEPGSARRESAAALRAADEADAEPASEVAQLGLRRDARRAHRRAEARSLGQVAGGRRASIGERLGLVGRASNEEGQDNDNASHAQDGGARSRRGQGRRR